MEDDDRLIVIGDGERDVSGREIAEDFRPANMVYVECQRPGSVFGNAQRDFGMQLALQTPTPTSHLMFLDDDDVWVHGALDVVREAISPIHWENAAHVFRARWGAGHHAAGVELWADQEVRVGNVGTPMVVLPNRHYQASWWDANAGGIISDFGFLAPAIAECDDVVWHDPVIATVRP